MVDSCPTGLLMSTRLIIMYCIGYREKNGHISVLTLRSMTLLPKTNLFLKPNSITPSQIASHCLSLKAGCPIILLRNLDRCDGLRELMAASFARKFCSAHIERFRLQIIKLQDTRTIGQF